MRWPGGTGAVGRGGGERRHGRKASASALAWGVRTVEAGQASGFLLACPAGGAAGVWGGGQDLRLPGVARRSPSANGRWGGERGTRLSCQP